MSAPEICPCRKCCGRNYLKRIEWRHAFFCRFPIVCPIKRCHLTLPSITKENQSRILQLSYLLQQLLRRFSLNNSQFKIKKLLFTHSLAVEGVCIQLPRYKHKELIDAIAVQINKPQQFFVEIHSGIVSLWVVL